MKGSRVRIGVLGAGNVGAAFVGLVNERRETIAERHGVDLEVTQVAVRNLSRERTVAIDTDLFTHDAEAVVNDPEIDLVVELIGGIEPAGTLVKAALAAHKPVVSANKELLANYGAELLRLAHDSGVDLLFEAAVAGGIPLIRPLQRSLAGEDITRVMGIVNGTTNYVLTRMTEDGSTFSEAVAEAQALGYAERDPTADVEGFDASAKAAILASIAFGAEVVAGDVYREGITEITPDDLAYAARLGYVVKLLVIAERFEDEDGLEIAVRVHPAMLPEHHPLASVRDSFNAVFIEGEMVGELMFYGRGAGGSPTASAVLGDVIDAAVNCHSGKRAIQAQTRNVTIRPIDEMHSQYYLNMYVADRPGALAAVAGVFGRNNVSIRSMEQEGFGDRARLVFITHDAREAAMQETLTEIRELDSVLRVVTVLRVIDQDNEPLPAADEEEV